MSQTQKPAWPQTPDGTTDWEVVFESSDNGFIPLISQANSAEALRQTTHVVIEKLFTRKNDVAEVESLKIQLEAILTANTEIAAHREGVARLLRDIKETRIEKARIYIQRKKSGAAIDRRSGWLWKIDFLLRPRVLIPLSLIFVISVASSVFFLLDQVVGTPHKTPSVQSHTQPTQPTEPQPQPVENEAENPREDAPAQTVQETLPQDPAEDVAPDPIRVILQTVRWPLAAGSTSERPQYFSVILYVADRKDKVTVCQQLARVMDRIFQAFNFALPQNHRAQDRELNDVAKLIPGALNMALNSNIVLKADVFRYGDQGFLAASSPPYCRIPDADKNK